MTLTEAVLFSFLSPTPKKFWVSLFCRRLQLLSLNFIKMQASSLQVYWKDTLAQTFSYKFCEIIEIMFFISDSSDCFWLFNPSIMFWYYNEDIKVTSIEAMFTLKIFLSAQIIFRATIQKKWILWIFQGRYVWWSSTIDKLILSVSQQLFLWFWSLWF